MSHGKIEKFARMANQIGDYYASQPPDEAAEGVALHIKKFWTPKMIAETIQGLDAGKLKLNATSAEGFAILRSEIATSGE